MQIGKSHGAPFVLYVCWIVCACHDLLDCPGTPGGPPGFAVLMVSVSRGGNQAYVLDEGWGGEGPRP